MADLTLAEIMTEANKGWDPNKITETEIESWSEVKAPTDDTCATWVGLVGMDLTSFLEACVTSTACDDTDY